MCFSTKILPFSTPFNFCLFLIDSSSTSMQTLKINPEKKDIDSFVASDLKLIDYDPLHKIEMKMAI